MASSPITKAEQLKAGMLFDVPATIDGSTIAARVPWLLIEPGDNNPRNYLWVAAPLNDFRRTKLLCFDQEFSPEQYNFRTY